MAATEEELIKFNNKLKKVADGLKDAEEAHGVFEFLEKLDIDDEIINVIHRSQLAQTINELRKKTTDDKLAKRGKTLIRKWKALFESQQTKSSQPKKSEEKKKTVEKQKSETPGSEDDDSNPSPAIRKNSNGSKPSLSSKPKFFKQVMPTDEKRARIVSVLLTSFQKGGELPDGTQDPEDVAARVEAALYERFGDTNTEYINASRSLAFNLRDKKNPDLRLNVLTGAVSAKRFANMTTAEMASDAMKQQREAFNKEGILEHQMSVNEGTPTDMFRCGKCGKSNCTYTQLQTRSADEPMTTFVFCRSCGNRWKFC